MLYDISTFKIIFALLMRFSANLRYADFEDIIFNAPQDICCTLSPVV